MNYIINTLTAHRTGAEILNLNLAKPVDEALREELNRMLAQYHVLVFRDQNLTPKEFARAGEIFGEIMPQHHKQLRAAENVEVYSIKNEEISPGKYFISGESYHTDHSDHAIPPKATALHAVTLPSKGGDTQFVNMHIAYDELPLSIQNRIDKLEAVHVFQSKYSPRALRKIDDETLKTLAPPAVHPLVRVHPENGRKFLYLNPVRMESIKGLSDEEALALINELMAHSTKQKYEYRHQWKYGDMVIWDNRSVMHQANGDYDMSEKRHLYRLMVRDRA